MIVVIVVVNLS